MKQPDMETLSKAKEIIAENYGAPDGVHTVMIGFNKVDGRETGEPAIVCLVENKMSPFQLKAHGEPIVPPSIVVDGIEIPTDIQVAPKPKDQRLFLPPGCRMPQAVTTHQRCHDCPIPGGVQIAPQGKNWVGTLGAAIKFEGSKYGAITNAHVTGLDGTGNRMVQPSQNSDYFATVHKVVPIQFGGVPNYIDAAILDTLRTGGPYGSGCHTVKPEQLDLGKIVPSVKSPALGDLVHKSGRTTGVTRGRCTGIEATTYVGYDEGSAKFDRQLYVEAEGGGNFSAGGDSGSLVLTRDNKPWGLLFAGGGGSTVCNPIAFVLEWAKGEFFQI